MIASVPIGSEAFLFINYPNLLFRDTNLYAKVQNFLVISSICRDNFQKIIVRQPVCLATIEVMNL